MTGTDEPFKYKAMAAQIVSAEGMGNLLPAVEKELLRCRIPFVHPILAVLRE